MNSFLAQFGQPRGPLGMLAAVSMLRANRALNRCAIDRLEARPGQRILDVGFGPGYALRRLSSLRVCLFGIDVSRLMARLASQINRGARGRGQVGLAVASAGAIPLRGDCCDGVLAVNTLAFWEDASTGLAEIHRILKPGGRLVIAMQPRRASAGFRFDLAEHVAGLLRRPGWRVECIDHVDLRPAPAVFVVASK